MRYLTAVVLVALAVVIRQALRFTVGGDVPLSLVALAVVLSAWRGGMGPGLLATLLSLVSLYELFGPHDPMPITPARAALRAVLFGVAGVLFSLLAERRLRAQRTAESTQRHARLQDEELQRSEERYRRIVETAQEGIWELDAQGRVTYVNRRLADMLGYAPPELEGRPALEFLAPDSRPAAEESWGRHPAGDVAQAELEMLRRDGARLWVRASSTPVRDTDGSWAGAFSMVSDLTAQKRAEAALRSREARRTIQVAVTRVLAEAPTLQAAQAGLLEAVGAILGGRAGALWMIDEQGDALRCAAFWGDPSRPGLAEFEAATKTAPVALGVDLPGRVWIGCEPVWVQELDEDANFTRLPSALAAGLRSGMAFPLTLGRECIGVVEFFTPDPRLPDSDLLERFTAIGDQVGQFLERKRVEEDRLALLEREQAARQEAEAAGRAKDEFLATLSHELRTPLNAIVGWAHLLRLGQLDPATAQRAVEVIDRNARVQAQIVADVLDVSRVVRGQLRLALVPLDMAEVVEAALETVRPVAEAKDIRLESMLAPGRVAGDRNRLQQVVWNLLLNAIKFTPEGGRVAVTLRHLPAHLELAVQDSGAGIASEFLPHVFERFRQQDSSSTRSHGGLGLGLALVRHLVELHGGAAHVASAGRGQGACFTVRLPVLTASTETAPHPRREGPAAAPRLSGISVLVVDDEPDARDLVSAALQAAGATVRTAASAEEAMGLIAAERPAVLVSDLSMPVTDGYTFIRLLRALPEEEGGRTPAAALSGFERAEDKRRALEAGYQSCLAKPARPRELAEMVASLARH